MLLTNVKTRLHWRIHSTFKCSLLQKREMVLCNKNIKCGQVYQRQKVKVTQTYQLLHCGTNDMCEAHIKDRTKETTILSMTDCSSLWTSQMKFQTWFEKFPTRGLFTKKANAQMLRKDIQTFSHQVLRLKPSKQQAQMHFCFLPCILHIFKWPAHRFNTTLCTMLKEY